MGLVEQLKRKPSEVRDLLNFAFPYNQSQKEQDRLNVELGVIGISDYDRSGMSDFYKMEIWDAFIIEEFIKRKSRKKAWKNLKTKFYLIPISKDRKGRTEIFDTLKAKFQAELQEEQQQGIRR